MTVRAGSTNQPGVEEAVRSPSSTSGKATGEPEDAVQHRPAIVIDRRKAVAAQVRKLCVSAAAERTEDMCDARAELARQAAKKIKPQASGGT